MRISEPSVALFALSISFLALTPAFADSCSLSPKQCSPKQLCAFATEDLNSSRNWTKNPQYSYHVKVAQELGMDCGLSPSCSNDAQLCNLDELCQKAVLLNNGRKSWKIDSKGVDFVAVAKSYNLTCGIESNENLPKYKCSEDAKYCENSEICENAIKQVSGKNVWQTGGAFSRFYLEAKNRNLKCGVVEKTKTKFSPLVRSIQQELNSVGCGVGSADGFLGKKTVGGIIRYVQGTTLEVDKSKVKNTEFLQNVHVRLLKESSMKNCLRIVVQKNEEEKAVPNELEKAAGGIMKLFGNVIECSVNLALLNPSEKCVSKK